MTAIVDDHVRSLMASTWWMSVLGQNTVKPWFDGNSTSPTRPAPRRYEFPLVGGRLDYIDGHSAAAVVYRHNKHFINLFIWPSTGPEKPDRTKRSRL